MIISITNNRKQIIQTFPKERRHEINISLTIYRAFCSLFAGRQEHIGLSMKLQAYSSQFQLTVYLNAHRPINNFTGKECGLSILKNNSEKIYPSH